MSNEYEPYPELNSRLPDFGSALAQRVAARSAEANGTLPPAGTVDPYQLMLQKKQGIRTEQAPIPVALEWPADQVTQLQNYCAKMGIVGFNCGRMNPLAALAMLKKQFGEDFSDVPLNERVPVGYEKMGTRNNYNASYPYTQRGGPPKQILHG